MVEVKKLEYRIYLLMWFELGEKLKKDIMIKVKRTYRTLRMLDLKYRLKKIYIHQGKIDRNMIFEKEIRYLLFVTNDNLGGTQQFELNYIKEHKHIIVLRRKSYGERPDLIYEITNCDTNRSYLFYLKELDFLWKQLFSSIIVNSMVHYSEVFTFLQNIVIYRRNNSSCRLIYMVHDFNAICVNCNLFVGDHYCGMQCKDEECLLSIADTAIEIGTWRKKWFTFLSTCDEIRCFSNSSEMLMIQAYPNLNYNKLTVVPHNISFIKFTQIQNIEKLPFHLGIIGNCNADFKGRPVVKKILRRYGNRFPITLVGSNYKSYRIRKKLVDYTGEYKHQDLQKVVEEKKISVFLFPSLWPETFSYLLSELIAMGLPVICFNYGAQAEKVKKYSKGIVCDEISQLWKIFDDVVQNEKDWFLKCKLGDQL